MRFRFNRKRISWLILAEDNLNGVSAVCESGDKVAVYGLAVNSHGLYAAANVVGVLDCDVVGSSTEKS